MIIGILSGYVVGSAAGATIVVLFERGRYNSWGKGKAKAREYGVNG